MIRWTLAPVLCLAAAPGWAQDGLNQGDTAWILTSTALVLFMTIPGLSLFYSGLVRTKNVLSVLMQCFALTCMVSLLWLAAAYSLAFGEGNALIGDLSKAFFAGVSEGALSGSIPESAFSLFQLTFGTITPASGFVGPAGALLIGIAAGFVCFLATHYIKRSLKIDDSLDVFPVHGVGGALGTLLTAVFASTSLGVFSGQGYAAEGMTMGSQLGVQAIGVAAVLGYTALATFIILKVTGALLDNRVTEEDELAGLDLSMHNERGYDL